MPSDASLDDEIRAATFAFVGKLRDQYGGRIPRDSLMEGVTVRGTRVPIFNPQAGIHKPQILGRDGAALTIQTSADSPYDDSHDPDSGAFVYKYRGQDAEQADNRALRQAMRQQKPLVYLVGIDPKVFDAVLPVYVTSDDPHALEFNLAADVPGLQPAAQPEVTAARRQYATRAVMERLHQHQFRRMVLSAYGNRCAICRLRHLELLDAAHILPDRHPKGEPIVSNGLGMCKIHHSAYDARILGIDPEARVHIRVDVLREVDGPMLRYGLQAVHNTRLSLPRAEQLRPNRDFLAERFEQFLAR